MSLFNSDGYEYSGLPLVGAGINALSQAGTNQANLEAVRETNQANRELAEYQAQFAESMWNKQNEYNTPSAQMERFAAAGLNPNLIYGQGSNGNSTSHPTYERPTMQAPHFNPVVTDGLGITKMLPYAQQLKAMQLDNERKEIDNDIADYQKSIKYQESLQAVTETAMKNHDWSIYRELKSAQLSAAKSLAERSIQEIQEHDQLMQLKEEQNSRAWSVLGLQNEKQFISNQQSWMRLDLDTRKLFLQEVLAQWKPRLDEQQYRRVEQLIERLDIDNDLKYIDLEFERAIGSKNANAFMRGLGLILHYLK